MRPGAIVAAAARSARASKVRHQFGPKYRSKGENCGAIGDQDRVRRHCLHQFL
jgi:hypothetical protein